VGRVTGAYDWQYSVLCILSVLTLAQGSGGSAFAVPQGRAIREGGGGGFGRGRGRGARDPLINQTVRVKVRTVNLCIGDEISRSCRADGPLEGLRGDREGRNRDHRSAGVARRVQDHHDREEQD
jgi:hypothetical protein